LGIPDSHFSLNYVESVNYVIIKIQNATFHINVIRKFAQLKLQNPQKYEKEYICYFLFIILLCY